MKNVSPNIGKAFLRHGVAVMALGIGLAAPSYAQEDVATAGGANAEENVIVVTGSRIARPELNVANPIVAITSENLTDSGKTNVTEYLLRNPALIGSTGNVLSAGSNPVLGFGETGVNLLNLRNLGTARTLVLVNGKRHVAGLPETAAVDINTIPQDLIERIDILTGGASAIYGADGVSGVVNFVLKNDFEGLIAHGQSGISSRGDGANVLGSLTAGQNFSDNRGNIAVSYEYYKQSRLDSRARKRFGDPLFYKELVRDPADFPDDPNVPDRRIFTNLRWADSSPDGAIDVDGDGASDFTGSGGIYDRGLLLPGSGGRTQGGSGTPTAGYFGDLIPMSRRHSVNALGSFEFSPAFRLFAEGKYVNVKAFSISQPTFDFGTVIAPDNPFLPPNVLAAFNTANAAGACDDPDTADAEECSITLNRDNYDLGTRGETVTRKTLRGVIGAEGEFNSHARYEVSYVYGQTKSRIFSTNNRITDRYFAALDAVQDPNTGQIICRLGLDPTANIDPNNFDAPPSTFSPGDCRPLNLMGTRVASQDALDFVTVNNTSFSKVTQQVVSGSISGDFGALFELPGGAIGFALGAEYRRETSNSNPDQLYQDGAILDSSQILPTKGKFNVKEAFAELNVPLLSDVNFAQTLSFGAALRLSDYSTIGKTTTWKVDGVYAPVKDIRFRGTYSKAVRAPNIGELFASRSGTFEFIDDPCDPTNIGEGTQFRAANCLATLQAAGLTPQEIANFSPSTDGEASTSQLGSTGGNPLLQEETARTWTAGVVLQPSFVRGLSLTFDWYNIRLKNAINTPDAQDVVDLCVDQPTLDNQFCPNVTREAGTGFVTGFVVGPQNVAEFRTAGADFTVNYTFNTASAGKFNVQLVGGYLDRLTFVPSIGADVDDDRQEQYAPKWQASADLTWSLDKLSINYNLTWWDKTRRFTTEQIQANPDLSDPKYFWYKERWEHDVRVAYDIDERFEIYFGVNNLTDSMPAVASLDYPISGLGRFLYAGARVRLASLK